MNYLLFTWKSTVKNKLFVTLNIFGLAISIGCSIVAYFNWQFHVQLNRNHVKLNAYYINQMAVKSDGVNRSVIKMFSFLNSGTLILSAMGLSTLAPLTNIKRTEDSEVRRVFDRSLNNILSLIDSGYFTIVIIPPILGALISFFRRDQ